MMLAYGGKQKFRGQKTVLSIRGRNSAGMGQGSGRAGLNVWL